MPPLLAYCMSVYNGFRGKVDLIPSCSAFVGLVFCLQPIFFSLTLSLLHFYTLLKILLPFSSPPLFQYAISVYPSRSYSPVSNPSSSKLLNCYMFAVDSFLCICALYLSSLTCICFACAVCKARRGRRCVSSSFSLFLF